MTKEVSQRVGGYDRQKWRWDTVAFGGHLYADSVFGPAVVAGELHYSVQDRAAVRLTRAIDGNPRTDLVIVVHDRMHDELQR